VDKIKFAVAALLVAAGVSGFYYLQESATVIRLAAFLAGLVAGAAVLWTTAAGQGFFCLCAGIRSGNPQGGLAEPQ